MLMLLGSGCAPTPKPIEYGSDMCHYCKMSIVDQQHAAEAVTSKSKVFKFDAVECLINYLSQQPGQEEYAFLLVNDYEHPGAMIPAESSAYLISPAIPSPMGAFLSAFSSSERAQAFQAEKGGEVFDWPGIQKHLARQ